MFFRVMSTVGALALAGTVGLAPQPSLASEDGPVTADVTGGVSSAKACAYPSVILLNTYVQNNPKMRASCTGTLIHPRVILYAAHCGVVTEAVFTENRTTPGRRTLSKGDFAKQRTNPRYGGVNDQAVDWAYLVLNKPVTDVPLIPMASGCERPMLQKRGATVYFAGFSPNDSKVKSMTRLRWAKTSIRSLRGGKVEAGGSRITACGGDSGGPLLARTPDGSWRTLGVASTLAGGCGTARGYNTYSLIGKAMTAWIEKETGIDVTPCADADGQPTPSLACDKFRAYSESPDSPTGTRPNTCSEAKSLPVKDTCKVPDSGEKDPDDEKDKEGGDKDKKDDKEKDKEGGDKDKEGDEKDKDKEGDKKDKEGGDKDKKGDKKKDKKGDKKKDKKGDKKKDKEDEDKDKEDDEKDKKGDKKKDKEDEEGNADKEEDDGEKDKEEEEEEEEDEDEDEDAGASENEKTVVNKGCSLGQGSESPLTLMGLFLGVAWIRRRCRK